jgi:hypothetical protein
MPDKIKDFGWYGAGWAVFKGGTADPDYYPPLADIEAQQEWLDGFSAAWADCLDDQAVESILHGDGTGGVPMEQALSQALAGRAALLQCLLPGDQGRAH